mgnify:CR=1 FL=1
MSDRKKGKSIHSEARNFNRNTILGCDREKNLKCLKYPVNCDTKRAASYIAESFVKKVREELKEKRERGSTSPLRTPNTDPDQKTET